MDVVNINLLLYIPMFTCIALILKLLSLCLLVVLRQIQLLKLETYGALVLLVALVITILVKQVNYLNDASGVLSKRVKPNFKALGPKFGKDMRFIASEVGKFTQEDINKIEKTGNISFEINGKNIMLLLQQD